MNAAKRFVVIDELYEPFLEKFTAALSAVKAEDPNSPDTTVGPLSSANASDRLEEQVKRAVDQGATLVTGGGRDGNFFETTILTDISNRQRRLPRGVLRPGRRGLPGGL